MLENENINEPQKPPFWVGSILIKKKKKQTKYNISSKHQLFKNEYIKVRVDECKLIFSVPKIDCNRKMYKPITNNKSPDWRTFTITNDLLIAGKFEIDVEESNEDELIVYYR